MSSVIGGGIERRSAALAGWVLVVAASVFPVLFVRPKLNYDSMRYLAPASWSMARLPVVPILYDALGHNFKAVAITQAVLGAVCWCYLIAEVAQAPTRWGAVLGVVAVALVACSTYVVNWYGAILSDSLSISLLVLILALVVRLRRRGGSKWPLALVVSIWALTRPTNGEVGLIAVVVLLPVAALRFRRELVKLIATGLICGLAILWAAQGTLWQQPFEHSLTERILPSPDLRDWFVAHGMPLTPELEQQAGPFRAKNSDALNNSPALAAFRTWMDSSAQHVYTEFLVTHPVWALEGAFKPHQEFNQQLITYYGGGVARSWYPESLSDLLMTHRQAWMLAVLAVDGIVVLALAVTKRLRAVRTETVVWLGLILLGIAALTLDWAADSWEIPRHSIDGTLMVVLSGLLAAIRLPGQTSRTPGRQKPARYRTLISAGPRSL